jgi:hypothetical protein
MPSISDRLASNYHTSASPMEGDTAEHSISIPIMERGSYQNALQATSQTVLSVPGNPGPLRGQAPAEFTSDTDASRFFPFTSMVRSRGSVDVNTYIRNLALQALQKAFGQSIK